LPEVFISSANKLNILFLFTIKQSESFVWLELSRFVVSDQSELSSIDEYQISLMLFSKGFIFEGQEDNTVFLHLFLFYLVTD
jgi:hypothetical protein